MLGNANAGGEERRPGIVRDITQSARRTANISAQQIAKDLYATDGDYYYFPSTAVGN